MKETSTEITANKIKCTLCEFEALSENGLKVHMKRKHTEKTGLKFPILVRPVKN